MSSTPADQLEFAQKLRHYGLEALKLAAEIEANVRQERAEFTLPIYWPRFEVVDGVETITNRLACCGSGPDRTDDRTGERLHLPGCVHVLSVAS